MAKYVTYKESEELENLEFKSCSLYVDPGNIVPLKKDWSSRFMIVTEFFAKNCEKILNFEGRSDDVYVVTMSKSGTTWMLEAAWLILNEFDFDRASKIPIMEKAPYLEHSQNVEHFINICDTHNMLREMKSPRLIRTHLSPNLLPQDLWKKQSKVIYVARNYKDAIISNYHFSNGMGLFKKPVSLEDFSTAFRNNQIFFTPYWDHLLEFWQMRNEPNVFFTSYERMSQNIRKIIKELCEFLGKPIPSEDVLDKAEEHLNFNSMKNSVAGKLYQKSMLQEKLLHNSTTDYKFLRKGQAGSFKDEMSQELAEKLDKWAEENLQRAGITVEELYGV